MGRSSPLLHYLIPRRWLKTALLMCVLVCGVVFLVAQGGMVMTIWPSLETSSESSEELDMGMPGDTQGKDAHGFSELLVDKLLLLLLRRDESFLHSEQADGNPPLPDNVTPQDRSPVHVEKSESSQLSFNQSHCRPLHPSVMFFVRIPKCASTSFIEVLHKLSNANDNFELFFHPSGAFNWDWDTKAKVANLARSKARPGRRFVYARHFYHVDFRQFGLENYTYLTLMRDPVTRLVSSYLYYHFSSKPHIQRILNPRYRNESFEECLKGEHDGCKRNLMTKYFCGHMKFCGQGDKRALERAKENLRAQFAAVGIMEQTDVTLKVFKAVLPEYFHGLDPSREVLPLLNPNEHHMSLNGTLVHTIEDTNFADVELYKYARSLLFQRARDCGVLNS